jgi:hypothetical protein
MGFLLTEDGMPDITLSEAVLAAIAVAVRANFDAAILAVNASRIGNSEEAAINLARFSLGEIALNTASGIAEQLILDNSSKTWQFIPTTPHDGMPAWVFTALDDIWYLWYDRATGLWIVSRVLGTKGAVYSQSASAAVNSFYTIVEGGSEPWDVPDGTVTMSGVQLLPQPIAGNAVDSEEIADAVAENSVIAAIKAKTDLISSAAKIVLSNPTLNDDGTTLQLVVGDDHTVATRKPIEWTDRAASWPDLTGATLTLRCFDEGTREVAVAVTGTRTAADPQTIRFELTKAQVALVFALPIPRFVADATLADTTSDVSLRWGGVQIVNNPRGDPVS